MFPNAALATSAFLAFTTGILAAPAVTNSTGTGTGSTIPVQVTPEDILNAPGTVDSYGDPSWKPIPAGSNNTILSIIPDFAAPISALPSIQASISSVAATATVIATAPTTTSTAQSRRDLNERTVPPANVNPSDIDCFFNPSFPTVNYNLWKAAITVACHRWFDPSGPPYTSPTVFLYEGSSASTSPGPPSFQFQFTYWIQADNGVPWDNYHAYTGDKCIAQLEAYALAAWAPNAAGWPTSAGECFDTSGFDTFADPDNFIVFSVSSPA